MASIAMHLAIAKLYLENHPEEDEEEFIKGSIEPDLVPYNEKGRTHYGLNSAWSNPAKYLQENGRSIGNSRKRGYFLHLVTDYLFYHELIDIDKILNQQKINDIATKQNTNIYLDHRNDFSVLESEIEERYRIEGYIAKLPDNVKNVMTKIQGKLKVLERESLFEFLEDMAKIDLDKMVEELLLNPEADLIKLYEKLKLL